MDTIKNAWNSMSTTVSNSVSGMVGTKTPGPSAMEELQQTGSTTTMQTGGKKRKSRRNANKRKSVKKSKSKKGNKQRKYKSRRNKKKM